LGKNICFLKGGKKAVLIFPITISADNIVFTNTSVDEIPADKWVVFWRLGILRKHCMHRKIMRKTLVLKPAASSVVIEGASKASADASSTKKFSGKANNGKRKHSDDESSVTSRGRHSQALLAAKPSVASMPKPSSSASSARSRLQPLSSDYSPAWFNHMQPTKCGSTVSSGACCARYDI
jgi:hypothetical protein